MPRFIQFERPDGSPILINIEAIHAIETAREHVESTRLHYAGGFQVVRGSMDEIRSLIETK